MEEVFFALVNSSIGSFLCHHLECVLYQSERLPIWVCHDKDIRCCRCRCSFQRMCARHSRGTVSCHCEHRYNAISMQRIEHIHQVWQRDSEGAKEWETETCVFAFCMCKFIYNLLTLHFLSLFKKEWYTIVQFDRFEVAVQNFMKHDWLLFRVATIID